MFYIGCLLILYRLSVIHSKRELNSNVSKSMLISCVPQLTESRNKRILRALFCIEFPVGRPHPRKPVFFLASYVQVNCFKSDLEGVIQIKSVLEIVILRTASSLYFRCFSGDRCPCFGSLVLLDHV